MMKIIVDSYCLQKVIYFEIKNLVKFYVSTETRFFMLRDNLYKAQLHMQLML